MKHGVLLFCCIALAACTKTPQPREAAPRSESEFVLGTICTVTLYETEAAEAAQVFHDVFVRLHEIEQRMSASRADTDIDCVNQSARRGAVDTPVPVHPDVRAVLERALHYAALSDGAFDPTIGPLVKLWGIGTDAARLPPAEALSEALSLVNWRDVAIDPDTDGVFLRKRGMALDLGAIAKGYAADEAVRILQLRDVSGAIIDLGGNICVYGVKKQALRESPWRVGVQNPFNVRGAYLGTLELSGQSAYATSVVTSGVYERYEELDGTRYHHILSTRDGYPVQNGLLSVTILAAASIDADALSTTVFTLGYDDGRALVEALDDVEALFVFDDQILRATRGFTERFSLTDSTYRFAP
jgi:thiamine biosynthesis lipoprotein